MIGRLHGVVLDCPDPGALASFYQRLLGGRVEQGEPAWAGELAVGLGARALDVRPDRTGWQVYADPAGHPFCLVTS
ncbi:MAG TPA: VOC family protein [Kribbella sp.]|nr:VOC family protein [Kribbella sp.]